MRLHFLLAGASALALAAACTPADETETDIADSEDADADKVTDDLVLYDAKDLTTHAVIIMNNTG